MNISEYIKSKMSNSNVPILFIGSGLTKRYTRINNELTPAWEDLLKNIITLYDNTEFAYAIMKTKIKNENPNIPTASLYQKIAQEIEKEFDEKALKKELLDKELESQILEEYRKNPCSPMKIYISIFFSKIAILEDDIIKEELENLRKINNKPLIIITTNYDQMLENIFPEYDVVKGQNLLTQGHVGKIFKIHGCITEPSSIVITEEDYKRIYERQRVLNARLITFFAEHPVFFLGYSIDDINIQEFMENIYSSFLGDDKVISNISKKFVIVSYKRGEYQTLVEDYTISKNTLMPLKKISTDNYSDIYSAFKNFKMGVGLRELAIMEEIFYGAVKSNKELKIKMVGMDEYKKGETDEILVGFGTIVANYFTLKEHYETTILFDKEKKINPLDFMITIFPDFCRRYTRSRIPFYKYLNESLDNIDQIDKKLIKIRHEKFIEFKNKIESKNHRVRTSISEILDDNYTKKTYKNECIKFNFLKGNIREDDFIDYIHTRIKKITTTHTDVRDMIMIYDYKKYATKKVIDILENIDLDS